jgi:RNA polymerase sigma factor (sigma-70 family)
VTQIDTPTLQQLIDSHGPALRLYAGQWCRSPDDAVQEALIDLLQQDPVPTQLAAWLFTVVRRRAMNISRAERRRANHQTQAGQQQRHWFTCDDDQDSPDWAACLAQLPQLEREILTTRIWGGLSFAEIAQLVEQPLSTVHRRYQKALGQLGSMLEEPVRQTDEV